MIVVSLLIAASVAEAHWPAILACPRISVPRNASGTGVVIGKKDGFGYLLTAAHVIGDFDAVELAFTSRERYPKPVWYPENTKVLARWPDADIALVRFSTDRQTVPVIPLAPAWQRPKTFPVNVRTIGIGSDPAATLREDTIEAKEFVTRENKQPAFFWKTQSPPELGRSGGPLLDAQGRVIGIAIAASGKKGFYAHHDEVLAALKQNGFSWLVSQAK